MSSLFIGLGGVGTGTLENLSKKMMDYNDSLSSQGRTPVQAYYYYIDTDESIYNEDPSRFSTGTGMSFKLLGQNSPDSLIAGYNSIGNTDYSAWYDAAPKKTNLILGADSTRQYSRLALKSEYTNIYNDLTTLISNVVAPQSKGRIYVVTGSCGGTGCGIYMDLLYMIGDIYEALKTSNQQTDVRLIMAMPQGYIPSTDDRTDVQHQKTKLNAFATLSELNAVCKDTYTKNAANLGDSSFSFCNANQAVDKGSGWSFGPFRFGYLYDSANQSRKEVSQKMADFIFEIELEGMQVEVGALKAGKYSGSAFDIMLTNQIEADWKNSAAQPYAKAFCSMGQFTIEKPDDIWRKYFKERLLYDVFHKGLIDSEIYKTDTSLVMVEANKLQRQIEEQIANICEEIERSVTNESLKTENLGDTVYKVFTTVPDVRNELTKTILDKKAILFDRVKRLTYNQCREWLKQYDLTTVYKIVDWLDVELYKNAVKDYNELPDNIDNAKADSRGGVLKKWKPEKAVEQFKILMRNWLTFEVNKILTAGDNNDITIDSKGYLDDCKTFITNTKRMLVMPKENEEWESEFKKKVDELKLKDDRCFLPELCEILDNNSNIIRESTMVVTYESDIVMDKNKANLQEGTCSINMLQEEIFKQMSADKDLIASGIVIDKLYDPTPGASDSLRRSDKASRFVEEYINKANGIIDGLLGANAKVQSLFNTDIVTRLAQLGKKQRAGICHLFKQYDNVELKTVDLPSDAVSTYKVFISNFNGNTALQQELGVVNVSGNAYGNSAIIDDPFYSDKIVKLIVKACYSIDQYRYFADYKKYANTEMTENQPHDPFIDKRFKGAIKRGVYEMDVYKTMRDISVEARKVAARAAEEQDIQDEYNKFSLNGCGESEIYAAVVSTLVQYFNYLDAHKLISNDFAGGITISSTTVTLKKYKYQRVTKRYIPETDVNIVDLTKKYGVNDFASLDMWIDTVMSMKDQIPDENALISNAFIFLLDNGIKFSDTLSERVANMQGDGKKPLYDFLRAYQNWLKNI